MQPTRVELLIRMRKVRGGEALDMLTAMSHGRRSLSTIHAARVADVPEKLALYCLLAPERVMMPDETALEILRHCNGRTSLGSIIDELAAAYDADRQVIADDVCRMVEELAGKGILRR